MSTDVSDTNWFIFMVDLLLAALFDDIIRLILSAVYYNENYEKQNYN